MAAPLTDTQAPPTIDSAQPVHPVPEPIQFSLGWLMLVVTLLCVMAGTALGKALLVLLAMALAILAALVAMVFIVFWPVILLQAGIERPLLPAILTAGGSLAWLSILITCGGDARLIVFVLLWGGQAYLISLLAYLQTRPKTLHHARRRTHLAGPYSAARFKAAGAYRVEPDDFSLLHKCEGDGTVEHTSAPRADAEAFAAFLAAIESPVPDKLPQVDTGDRETAARSHFRFSLREMFAFVTWGSIFCAAIALFGPAWYAALVGLNAIALVPWLVALVFLHLPVVVFVLECLSPFKEQLFIGIAVIAAGLLLLAVTALVTHRSESGPVFGILIYWLAQCLVLGAISWFWKWTSGRQSRILKAILPPRFEGWEDADTEELIDSVSA